MHLEHIDEDIMKFGLAKKSQMEALILKTKPFEEEKMKESFEVKAEDEVNTVLFTVTPRDWVTLKQGRPLSSNLVGAYVNAIDFNPQNGELCGVDLHEGLRLEKLGGARDYLKNYF